MRTSLVSWVHNTMNDQPPNNPPIPLVLPPPTTATPPLHTRSRSCSSLLLLLLQRLLKSFLLLLLFFLPFSTLIFSYAYLFQLPTCQLNVPTTFIPFHMATSGVASTATSYFSNLLLRTTTMTTTFNTEDLTEEFNLEIWKQITKTKSSFEVGIWLMDDFIDAVKHVVLLHNDKSVRIKRAARAVRILSLQEDVTPFHYVIATKLEKWSNRKVCGVY